MSNEEQIGKKVWDAMQSGRESLKQERETGTSEELLAIAAVHEILIALSCEARTRAIHWLMQKYGVYPMTYIPKAKP